MCQQQSQTTRRCLQKRGQGRCPPPPPPPPRTNRTRRVPHPVLIRHAGAGTLVRWGVREDNGREGGLGRLRQPLRSLAGLFGLVNFSAGSV